MRVITGAARGKKLKHLQGEETRPTAARVKASVFNIIQFDIEGRRVLDLFAGTGQLGIEALSRGAASCTFLDVRRQAVGLIRDNLRHTGLAERARVIQSDFLAYISRAEEKFDLVFLDPPYSAGLLEKALEAVSAIDIVSENGIILCESMIDRELPQLGRPYEKGREYRYGKIKITLYHRRGEN